MRKLLLLCVLLCLSIVCFAQTDTAPRKFRNHPLPDQPDTLRILGIGNSFTDDGMMFLPDLVRESGVGPVVLARVCFGGCSLEQHCRFYEQHAARYVYSKTEDNIWKTASEKQTLKDALTDERWDIVVVQQASSFSGLYKSFSPWLGELLGAIAANARNPKLCVAWQMTWSYASDSTHGGFVNYDKDSARMYWAIVHGAKHLKADYGIKVVIPTGTAVQNLREHGVNGSQEVTRDGFHLDLGLGRYAAACTWFETLIAPVYGCTVEGNTFRIPEPAASNSTPVTDAVAADSQRAACLAAERPFHPTVW